MSFRPKRQVVRAPIFVICVRTSQVRWEWGLHERKEEDVGDRRDGGNLERMGKEIQPSCNLHGAVVETRCADFRASLLGDPLLEIKLGAIRREDTLLRRSSRIDARTGRRGNPLSFLYSYSLFFGARERRRLKCLRSGFATAAAASHSLFSFGRLPLPTFASTRVGGVSLGVG